MELEYGGRTTLLGRLRPGRVRVPDGTPVRFVLELEGPERRDTVSLVLSAEDPGTTGVVGEGVEPGRCPRCSGSLGLSPLVVFLSGDLTDDLSPSLVSHLPRPPFAKGMDLDGAPVPLVFLVSLSVVQSLLSVCCGVRPSRRDPGGWDFYPKIRDSERTKRDGD